MHVAIPPGKWQLKIDVPDHEHEHPPGGLWEFGHFRQPSRLAGRALEFLHLPSPRKRTSPAAFWLGA
ncbi:MAG TPA: hypothetical protein VGQ81_16825, partial [Acidobacteriota bacterium]|nr:hypothetical protein [Acidobacteriota bacterium]